MADRWWAPAAAAVAVVLVGAGTVVWLGDRGDPPARSAARPTAPPTAAPTAGADPADLLVRDGDQVAASGRVLALPGRPVRLCAPTAEARPAYPEGQEPLPAYCDLGITVRGLDLDAITDRAVDRGVVTGTARVEGRYAAGVVTVTRQGAPDPETGPPSSLPERPPCPPPAGGWRPGEAAVDPLARYLAAHPDQYVDLWLTYPDGYPRSDGGATPTVSATVPVVGTVLDPAAAERALRAVHTGNLCVVRVEHPASTLKKVTDRLVGGGDRDWREHKAYSGGPDGITGTVHVELVVLDAAAQRWLRQVDDRTGTVVPRPWVRPLG